MIGTCTHCARLFDAPSEEAAIEPGALCTSCWREGWRPDGIGGIYKGGNPWHDGHFVQPLKRTAASPS